MRFSLLATVLLILITIIQGIPVPNGQLGKLLTLFFSRIEGVL